MWDTSSFDPFLFLDMKITKKREPRYKSRVVILALITYKRTWIRKRLKKDKKSFLKKRNRKYDDIERKHEQEESDVMNNY